MDVERIQKINNLALDLVNQGLAKDREEAIAQAEKIYTGKDAEEYNSMRETLEEVKKDTIPVTEQVTSTEELSQNQIKDILKQNTEFIVKTFREINEKMASLESEIGSLRTKLTHQRLPTAEQVVASKVEEVETKQEELTVEEAAEPAKAQATEKPAAPTHPRSGNYKDADVSIEKFFYMGK